MFEVCSRLSSSCAKAERQGRGLSRGWGLNWGRDLSGGFWAGGGAPGLRPTHADEDAPVGNHERSGGQSLTLRDAHTRSWQRARRPEAGGIAVLEVMEEETSPGGLTRESPRGQGTAPDLSFLRLHTAKKRLLTHCVLAMLKK